MKYYKVIGKEGKIVNAAECSPDYELDANQEWATYRG